MDYSNQTLTKKEMGGLSGKIGFIDGGDETESLLKVGNNFYIFESADENSVSFGDRLRFNGERYDFRSDEKGEYVTTSELSALRTLGLVLANQEGNGRLVFGDFYYAIMHIDNETERCYVKLLPETPEAVAERTGIPLKDTREVIDRLVEMGLVSRSKLIQEG